MTTRQKTEVINLSLEQAEKYRDFKVFLKDQGNGGKDAYFEGDALADWVDVTQMSAQDIAYLLSGKETAFDKLESVQAVLSWFKNPDEKQKLLFKRSNRAASILQKLRDTPELYKEVLMLLVIEPAIRMHLVALPKMQDLETLKQQEDGEDESYD